MFHIMLDLHIAVNSDGSSNQSPYTDLYFIKGIQMLHKVIVLDIYVIKDTKIFRELMMAFVRFPTSKT